jgi:hypothetical protein
MTGIQDHYARNINIIKTSCPVISIASHRTHTLLFGGKYITHGPSSLSHTDLRSFGAGGGGGHKEMSSNCSHKRMVKTGFKIYLFAKFGK